MRTATTSGSRLSQSSGRRMQGQVTGFEFPVFRRIPVSMATRRHIGESSSAVTLHRAVDRLHTETVEFIIRDYRASDFDPLWEIDQICFPPGIAYTQMDLTGFVTRRKAITRVAEFAAGNNAGIGIAGF